ncbi:MAG: hypothetical protein U9P12_09780 [Verrucomicrobiota bacterium]|nr:hypothetical protein [Verrucomicrobiota bacterium]
MANRINGCFDSARKLKTHNPEVLCGFLEAFPAFLSKAKISLPADRDPDQIPYGQLLDALMSPSAPNELAVQLILVSKLANETGWQEVEYEAKQRGVPIPSDIEKLCDGDRAMKVWTVAQPDHPDLLEESFARARIYKKSSYTYYPMGRDLLDRFQSPDDSALKELEAELNAHFDVDEGTKVLKYDFEAETWFLIRHPGIVQWQGVYEKGRVKSRAVTPELYDAVVYHKKYGDLRMNTHRKSDHKRYRIAFGHLLFDEANVFDPHRRIVGLRPLWRDAEDVCKTGDIPGLHQIRISEVCFFALSQGLRRVTWRADKENESLPLSPSNRVIPEDTDTVLYAKFRYRLKSVGKWQGLTVHTGKSLSYERDGDSSVLEDWLRGRAFIDARIA